MNPGIENEADWNMPELPFASATVSETWLNVLYGYTPKLRWMKLRAEKRPEPTAPAPSEPMSTAQVIPLRRPRS